VQTAPSAQVASQLVPQDPSHVAPLSHVNAQLAPWQSKPQLPEALQVQLAAPTQVQSGPPGHAETEADPPQPNGTITSIPAARTAPITKPIVRM
jgi:hypothetical protein